MKKSLKQKLKKFLTLTVSVMLVFLCGFFATGCNLLDIDDGDGGSSNPSTEITVGDNSQTIYTLTIYVNGGKYPGSEGDVIIKGNQGNTYTLQNPTRENYTFDGWSLFDGPGEFNGLTFKFGAGDAKIKATWQGALVPDLHDYMQGARFTYKPEPELLRGTDYETKIIDQLNVMGIDAWSRLLNIYFDGAEYAVISPDFGWADNSGYYINEIKNYLKMFTQYPENNDVYLDTLRAVAEWQAVNQYNLVNSGNIASDFVNQVIANYRYHLQFLYVGVITGQYEKQSDGSYEIVNKNGLNYEQDLNYIISNEPATIGNRYGEKISDYAIYIDHTGLLDFEQEIFADLILTEIIGLTNVNKDTNFTNNDGESGFGAEIYFNSLATTFDENNQDISGTVDNWQATEIYAQTGELFDSEGNVKFIDEDNDKKFDCWTKQTFIDKGYCTPETYNHEDYYYHLYLNGATLCYEIKIASKGLFKSGEVTSNTYIPESGYGFDIRLKGFKNYENIVNSLVENMANATYINKSGATANAYPYFPALYVQDLDSDEITIDSEGEFFNNKILTNTADSGLSLQSVILNVKKSMFIQTLEFYVGFESDENVKLNLNVKARYYHNGQLYIFDFIDINGNKKISLENGEEPKSVSFDFSRSANALGLTENGLTLNPYSSKLNNYSVIPKTSNSTKFYRTKVATDISNFEQCFKVEQNASKTGAISEYADYSSDFLEILFDAEKIDGVAPSYNLTFFFIDPLVKE